MPHGLGKRCSLIINGCKASFNSMSLLDKGIENLGHITKTQFYCSGIGSGNAVLVASL